MYVNDPIADMLTRVRNAKLIAWCAPAGALPLLRLSSTLAFALRLDGLGMLFSVLVSVLWVPTTFYALEYIKHEGREKAFFSWWRKTEARWGWWLVVL